MFQNTSGFACVRQIYWHYQRGTLQLKIEQRPGARFAPGPACVCWSKSLAEKSYIISRVFPERIK